jgi:mTERF domain-containing protein
MFAFLYSSSRQLLFIKHRTSTRRTQLSLVQKNAFFMFKSFTSIGLSESEKRKEHSFTVSYLINSCGLSPKSALLASKKLHFKNPDRPDSVLNLFKENGFKNTQITKLITNYPSFLLSDPENTILPKIEFLRSIGVSSSELADIFSYNPELLKKSLKKNLIPNYDFLKSLLIENEKVITTLKRSQWSFLNNLTKTMVPNIELLREIGAPQSTISFLVTTSPFAASIQHSKLVKAVQEVKEMGFNPSRVVFMEALKVVLSLRKPTREYKFEIFRRWGWSKEDFLVAFRKHPCFMLLSEEKITKAMNYLVNKLGRPSTDIARNPVVLYYSLEKRIIPRCSVVQILIAKDVVKNDLCLSTFILITEKSFLERYVYKFQDIVSQLLSVYHSKMDLLDVEIQVQKVGGTEKL